MDRETIEWQTLHITEGANVDPAVNIFKIPTGSSNNRTPIQHKIKIITKYSEKNYTGALKMCRMFHKKLFPDFEIISLT